MRYDDASDTASTTSDTAPVARADHDSVPVGSMGPANGNVISGAGTETGLAGADTVGDASTKVVELRGAGGSADTGATLHVPGQYGALSMDPEGSYNYVRNAGTPDGVQDVFTYTLADSDNQRSSTTLTIEIDRTQTAEEKAAAAAQQLANAGDGVVTLPAGVNLSDIHVVGRDLVINMPDGTQMVIPGGAVFVPQLVIGDVEVPPTNVAALLIDAEPVPAAGTPQSSGGNFDVPVAPLDPGVPLGDLIPPTVLTYIPPEFEDVGQFIDRDPEIFIDPGDGNPVENAVDSVDESGLPVRAGETAGSSAASNDETTTGSIIYDSPDDPSEITIRDVHGNEIAAEEGAVIEGAHGWMSITAVAEGEITYSYTLADNADHSTSDTHDDFIVTITDNDGDTDVATLTINIVDDVPTARPDTDSIAAGAFGPATGNVLTDAAPGDAGDSDMNAADIPGADGAALTSITGFGATANGEGGFIVQGHYGVLTIDTNGDYSYTRNQNTPGGVTETFNYTITDGDGDTSSSTLTISIGDLPVTVGANATVLTDDDAIPAAGGNPGGVGDDVDAANLTGTLSGSGGDGTLSFSVLTSGAPAGFAYVSGGAGIVLVQQGGTTVLTVSVNSNGAYSVIQNAPIDHAEGVDENNTSFAITYSVTDLDGDSATGSLVINVDDDTPTINRAEVSLPGLVVDETDLATTASGDFSTVFNGSYGADGAGSTSYAVGVVNGADSGLTDVATGDPILLFNNGGVVEGRVGGADGAIAFTVAVNSGTGVVTLDQVRALDHPNMANPDDSVSPIPGSIQLTATITDSDGDPVSLSVNIGGQLSFEDDGPSVDITLSAAAEPTLVTQDSETDGNPTALDSATANFAASFSTVPTPGADGTGSLTVGYALGVSSQGVDSGLNQSGANIYLYQVGGVVIGSTSATQAGIAAGNTVFDVTANGSGQVTLTQYSQIDHPIAQDPSATGAPFVDQGISLADGLVTLTATATLTDGDGDAAMDSQALNIGANLVFQDDGPDISAVLTGTQIRIDETDGVVAAGGETDAPGGNLGTVTVNAASLFTVSNVNLSADTPTTLGYGLALSSSGVASGLLVSSTNAAIYLYDIGGVVTGSTSATQGGVTAGNTAFTLSINSGTGAVTMTQFLAVEHSNTGSNDEDSSGLAAGALSIVVTATDFDGDTDQASVDLGSIIRFEDDGPSASADTDSIVGGNGPATGNVITGVDIVGGDANGTDGVADSIGSDSPGRITAVTSVNMPGNVDTDGSANFVIAGQYGTLTLNANGDYSYLRAGGPGGVSDVFTYTLTDADGDSVTTTLTIGIDDRFPTGGNVNVQLDDDAVVGAGGNAGGTGDDADATNTGGQLPGSGGDGTLTFSVSLTGAPAGFTYVSGGSGIVLVQQGGTTVLTVTVQPNGQYAVVQNAPIDHPDGLDENNVSFTVNYTVTDQDLDSAPGTITINVDDDTPTVDVSLAAVTEPTLITQDGETDGTPTAQDTASANFALMFNVAASDGADGPASPVVTYALGVSSQGVDSGLDQGGANIYLYNIGGSVVGSTSATQVGVTAGNTVFGVAVNATGTVTLTQYSQIDHLGGDPTPTGPGFTDHSVSLADGLVTLTASGTITDTDNDSATDSQVLNIGANLIFQDDGPDISAVLTGTAIRIDETDGVVAAGGETDVLGGNLGTVTVSAASLFTVSNVNVSADTPTTLAYALALSSNGVASGLLLSTSNAPIYLYNIGGVITGSTALTAGTVNAGNTAFTLSINSGTGAVTMTQFLAVEHSNPATPDEDSSGFTAGVLSVVVTATDYDGDTDQASVDLGSVIRFEDDAPSNFSPVDLTDDTNATVIAQDNALVNDGNANVTRLINDANNDGVGENFMGSDGFGSLAFTATGHTNGEALEDALGAALTSGGDAILVFGYGTGVLTATTDATNSDPNAVVFTATLAPNGGQGAASTYTLDFNQTIDNGAGFVLSDFSTAPAGQNKWIALDIDGNDIDVDNNDSPDLLITPTNLPGGTVNTSSTDLGNSNQWIDNGEGLRVDFVTDVRTGSGDEKVAGGYTFDGHYAVSGSSFQIMQTQGGGTASVRIAAYNDPDTGTLTTLSGSIVAIDPTSIVVTGDASYTIVDMGDGTFVITGLNAGANVAFDTNGVDYDAMAITSAAGLLNPATAAPADTFSGSPFAIGVFGYFTAAAGDPIDLNLGVTATDSDGDTSTGTIDITLVPDTSSSQAPLNTSKLQFSALLNDQQVLNKTGSAANSNTLLVGAIAATGLAVEPAAASGVADHGVSLVADTTAAKLAPSSPTLDSHDDVASSSAIVATSVSNDNARPENGNAHSSSDQAHESEGVAGQHNAESLAPTALSQGTEAPEQSAPAIVADSVAMPSAAAFQAPAADADVAGKHGGEVGRVISDALAGGGDHGAAIDAVLNALGAEGHGAPAANDALSSIANASVPAWDSGHFAAFTAGHGAAISEVMVAHMDAVQPAA